MTKQARLPRATETGSCEHNMEDAGMLVITRKVGEEIVIPSCGVVLALLDVRGDRVRIGIAAPPEVRVYRKEVWERILGSQDVEWHDPRPEQGKKVLDETVRPSS
jgi:carbon storage regulator